MSTNPLCHVNEYNSCRIWQIPMCLFYLTSWWALDMIILLLMTIMLFVVKLCDICIMLNLPVKLMIRNWSWMKVLAFTHRFSINITELT